MVPREARPEILRTKVWESNRAKRGRELRSYEEGRRWRAKRGRKFHVVDTVTILALAPRWSGYRQLIRRGTNHENGSLNTVRSPTHGIEIFLLVRSNFQGWPSPFLVRRYVAFPHPPTARKRGCNRDIGFSCSCP